MDFCVEWRGQHFTWPSWSCLMQVSCFTMYTWFLPVLSVHVHLQGTFCRCLVAICIPVGYVQLLCVTQLHARLWNIHFCIFLCLQILLVERGRFSVLLGGLISFSRGGVSQGPWSVMAIVTVLVELMKKTVNSVRFQLLVTLRSSGMGAGINTTQTVLPFQNIFVLVIHDLCCHHIENAITLKVDLL